MSQRASLPSLEEAESLLRSPRRPSREKGLQMLAKIGRKDLILEHCRSEPIVAVVESAAELFEQEPIELLVRRLTMVKGMDSSLAFRHVLPVSNYLYAEEAVVSVVASKAKRLHPDVIEGLGLAFIRTAAPLLLPYTEGRLISYAEAKARDGQHAVAGIRIFRDSDGTDTWSRGSACALAAVVSLCRLFQPPPADIIQRLLAELNTAMQPSVYQAIETRAQLAWALMEATGGGLEDVVTAVELGATPVLPDLLTSLLRRGQTILVEELFRRSTVTYCLASGAFVHWPLADFLIHRGLVGSEMRWRPLDAYRKARGRDVAPPPWWHWLSPPPSGRG